MLVDYMRQLHKTVDKAMTANLKDADLFVDDTITIDDEGQAATPTNPAIRVDDDAHSSSATTIVPVVVPMGDVLFSRRKQESMVVITAVAHSITQCASSLCNMVRRMILNKGVVE